jgi:hypothetical protein
MVHGSKGGLLLREHTVTLGKLVLPRFEEPALGAKLVLTSREILLVAGDPRFTVTS